jgi:hypothetical protein
MGAAKEEDWVWLDLAPCVEILAESRQKRFYSEINRCTK